MAPSCSRNIRYPEPVSAEHRKHWAVYAALRDLKPTLYDALMAAYAASEYPPVGREGAFPFALVERQEDKITIAFTELWNAHALEAAKEHATDELLALEKRLVKALTWMVDTPRDVGQ